MNGIAEILNGLLEETAPPADQVREAERRRDDVLRQLRRIPGVRRDYNSGSIAHGTANQVKDADCGIVLAPAGDFAGLGPDGDGTGPLATVEDIRDRLRDSGIKDTYPDAIFEVQDRSIRVLFHEPNGGCDPSVDVIVALDRKRADGLWIPKAMRSDAPSWDASHPEEHTSLFLSGSGQTRELRIDVTRLAKLANDSFSDGTPKFASFNLAALAYEYVSVDEDLGEALYGFYDHSVKSLTDGLTGDPAGVSDPIKLRGWTKDKAIHRMQRHRDCVAEALDATSDSDVRDALNKVFGDLVPSDSARSAVASALRSSATASAITSGREAIPVRSFGSR